MDDVGDPMRGDEGTPLATAQAKPVERLSSTTTRSPASARAWTMWLPIYPAPPVTRIVMMLARNPDTSRT
jgi:hypothetical protein